MIQGHGARVSSYLHQGEQEQIQVHWLKWSDSSITQGEQYKTQTLYVCVDSGPDVGMQAPNFH